MWGRPRVFSIRGSPDNAAADSLRSPPSLISLGRLTRKRGLAAKTSNSGARGACAFCGIVADLHPTSLVFQDAMTLAFLDLRQFHPGHTLVIPRQHVPDIRVADSRTAQAVMATVVRVAQAVAAVFPGDGLSIWHSAGEGANQEVPHLHFHVHPRRVGDNLLRVYPEAPPTPARRALERWASQLRLALGGSTSFEHGALRQGGS